jgi:signal transduction histidine kinase
VRHGLLQDVGFLQLFLAVISISGFLLAAAVLERQQAEAALAREQELLKDRERSEQALIRSEKLAATGRIAATIAHEINNPLAAITNLVYLLESEDLPQGARSQLATLSREVNRLSRITSQTLGFYRQPSSPSRLSVNELIDDLLDVYHRNLEAKNITVDKDYRSSGLLEAYRTEIQQVLANLILNACDAVEKNGRLFIATTDADSERIRITIADNGPGISRDNQPRIFEPFFSTKHDKGVGLGLWVSQGIVHKHGGEITFADKTVAGERRTEFSIVLPRRFPANQTNEHKK